MALITWVDESPRNRPALVAAFTGWNDAGDAASGALAWLASRWDTTDVASLDPEPFYDFADTRPHLRLEDDGSRSLIWPSNDLIAATVNGADTSDGDDTEVALLVGAEPQLKWRTFAQQIVDMAKRIDSPLVSRWERFWPTYPTLDPLRSMAAATTRRWPPNWGSPPPATRVPPAS